MSIAETGPEIRRNPGTGITVPAERNKGYAMGYSDTFMELLRRRSAATSARYLHPHLQAGMSLLDLGCGPGSITIGLSDLVYPGEVHGVDLNPGQLQTAWQETQELGIDNITLHQADATRLPFPSDSFDAVHCHSFLMHSPRIREQLAEIVRVLRPGGILGSRDMDVPTSFISPATPENRGMWEMLAEVVRQESGDPLMGRHLKTFFNNAKLEMIRTGFDTDSFTTPDEVDFLEQFLLEWGLSEEFRVRTGNSTARFEQWREEVKRWGQHPGAVGCFHFGFAVGRKT